MKKIFLLCCILLCGYFVYAQDPIGLPTGGGFDPGGYFPPLPVENVPTLSAPANVNSGQAFIISGVGESDLGYFFNLPTFISGSTTTSPAGQQGNVSLAVGGLQTVYIPGGSSVLNFGVTAINNTANPITATFYFSTTIYDANNGQTQNVNESVTVTILPSFTVTPPSNPPPSGTPPPSTSLTEPIYRLFSTNYGFHFYTTDNNERIYLLSHIDTGQAFWPWETYTAELWSDEGTMGRLFKDFQVGTVPVRRYYNNSTMDHMYSIDGNEEATLSGLGYNYEEIMGYAYTTQVPGTIPVYRYNSPTHGHFFTIDFNELSYGNQEYSYEGVAFYVFPN